MYYINLAHRTDRRAETEAELAALGWTDVAVRVEAVHVPERGALGCLRSHICALRQFVEDPAEPATAVIMEDDCIFRPDCLVQIRQFLEEHGPADWDVLMLASNTLAAATYKSYAMKVLNAQTTAAYALTRSFAKGLLKFWERTTPMFHNPSIAYPHCDMTWKVLQAQNRWFCLEPKAAIQRAGYSDIERRHTNYGV